MRHFRAVTNFEPDTIQLPFRTHLKAADAAAIRAKQGYQTRVVEWQDAVASRHSQHAYVHS